MYCQHCGNSLADEAEAEAHAAEAADAVEGVAETVSIAEVEIARINADRDVTLAKIEKGMVADALEAQDTENAVKAEILDQAMAEPEPDPVPVIMEDAPADETPAENEPPVVEAQPEPAAQRAGNVWW